MRLAPVTGRRNVYKAYRRLCSLLDRAGAKHDEYRLQSFPDRQKFASPVYGASFDVADRAENDTHYAVHTGFDPSGLNRHCAGQFLKDEQDSVYLAHSGGIAGGYRGVGRTALRKYYRRGDWRNVIWPDDRMPEYLVIGRLDARNFVHELAKFVHAVARLKGHRTKGHQPQQTGVSMRTRRGSSRGKSGAKTTFNREFAERLVRLMQPPRESNAVIRRHGLVVNGLHGVLKERGKATGSSMQYGNDQQRDLFEVDAKGQVRSVFEVKTATDWYSLYAGVGQLMLHSAKLRPPPRRVLVLPRRPPGEAPYSLEKLNITVLTFRWRKGRPVFPGLDEVLG